MGALFSRSWINEYRGYLSMAECEVLNMCLKSFQSDWTDFYDVMMVISTEGSACWVHRQMQWALREAVDSALCALWEGGGPDGAGIGDRILGGSWRRCFPFVAMLIMVASFAICDVPLLF